MDSSPPAELDAEGILRVLHEHKVRYVVIGGIAGVLHGSGLTTADLDITPARDDENLQRLSHALEELDAKLRISEGPAVAFPFDRQFLAGLSIVNLRTRLGDLDLCFQATGPGRDGTFTYEDLQPNAVTIELDYPVAVAALDDVIASKEAAGRTKDLTTLGTLYRLREILREQEEPPSPGA
jgi:hypothetical protein